MKLKDANANAEFLEKALETYMEENWDEADALSDLFDKGYVLDDFKYNEERYEWANRVASEHGLC